MIEAEAVDARIERIEIDTPERAVRIRFLGSPSVRVNGRDVEPGADARDAFGLMCRTYRRGETVEGAPPVGMIQAAIRASRGAGRYQREARTMVTAFILMNVERGRLKSIADDLLAISGIAEVYSVAGPYDMVAIARVKAHEDLNDLVTEHLSALDGIEGTETLIAFKTFAKKDLGLLWDIGVD